MTTLDNKHKLSKKPLQIISGKFRGQKIFAPDNGLTHPMGSREKNALFNALFTRIENSAHPTDNDGATLAKDNAAKSAHFVVLDLFAGSGALGLEAISRGASKAIFVEQDSTALAVVRENIRRLGVSSQTKVIKADAANLPEALDSFAPFSLILIDPPYDNFPAQLGAVSTMLAPGGLAALSHPEGVDPEEILPGLTLLTTKSHAKSRLSILQKIV